MDMVSKPIDIHGSAVRFRRVGVRENLRFATQQAAESDELAKHDAMLRYAAGALHSIDNVFDDGVPLPFPTDVAARTEFIERLGTDYVQSLVEALQTVWSVSDATLGK